MNLTESELEKIKMYCSQDTRDYSDTFSIYPTSVDSYLEKSRDFCKSYKCPLGLRRRSLLASWNLLSNSGLFDKPLLDFIYLVRKKFQYIEQSVRKSGDISAPLVFFCQDIKHPVFGRIYESWECPSYHHNAGLYSFPYLKDYDPWVKFMLSDITL